MPRNVDDKAVTILAERRLRLLRDASSADVRVFECVSNGDSFRRYRVEIDAEGRGTCGCAAYRKCSHIQAAMLWLAVLRPREEER